jgi:hypothetical protein
VQRTRLSRTTHGESTSTVKIAEMGRGGSFWSGRKVCFISGRRWKDASSAWMGAGAERGTTRSKRSIERGE